MNWLKRIQPAPQIDWFRVLMDLKRAGLSLQSIATFVDVSKSAVIGWKNLDAEPKHGDGERLIALWIRTTTQPRAELPEVSDGRESDQLRATHSGGLKRC